MLSGGLGSGVHPVAQSPPLAFSKSSGPLNLVQIGRGLFVYFWPQVGGCDGKTVKSKASGPSLAPQGLPSGLGGEKPGRLRRAGRGRGSLRGARREGPGGRPASGGVFVCFPGVTGDGWPGRECGDREQSLVRSGREERRRGVTEEAETGGRRRGEGARVGEGKGRRGGGRGDQA